MRLKFSGYHQGVVAAGELHVYDSSGNKLRVDNFDPAPLLGATFNLRF
jgi:hypothetical protein